MKQIFLILILICTFGCKSDDIGQTTPQTYNILSLGDSYTIGQSVCGTCGFPEQLVDSLIPRFNAEDTFNLKVIAQTGWTTTNLILGLNQQNLSPDYDLVTLLIGVNNQFQGRPFETFETEFDELVNTSIALAKGKRNNVIIINIIDYANTAFGQNFGGPVITEEITAYNAYIANYCTNNSLILIDAQNLIFEGLTNPELIASDNLHPSELAYSNLVTQLLPLANEILLD
jgi:lysophospholipase L1-like esterase